MNLNEVLTYDLSLERTDIQVQKIQKGIEGILWRENIRKTRNQHDNNYQHLSEWKFNTKTQPTQLSELWRSFSSYKKKNKLP